MSPINFDHFKWTLIVLLLSISSCAIESDNLVLDKVSESPNEGAENANFTLDEVVESGANFKLGPWNIVYEETFENEPFYAYVTRQFPESHSFRKSTSPTYKGGGSGRFELRKGDRIITLNGGPRSEILIQDQILEHITDKEAWYSFAVYFPSNGFGKDSGEDLISQWHQSGTPALSLRVKDDRMNIRFKEIGKDADHIDLGAITKDSWQQFVFHVIHSHTSTGLVEVWRNGTKILTKSGPNTYDDDFPNWKLGIYRPSWEDRTTETSTRVVYFDNIRVGNSKSNLDEMMPSKDNLTGWGPYIPSIKSYSLINTVTDKIVETVPNNGKINIKMLNTDKISLRANFDEPFAGSTYFDLRGARTQVQTDNSSPFTLYGESSSLDYYNGGGTPVGEYVMTTTTYADKNRTGKIGETQTFRFNVVSEEASTLVIPNVSGFNLINAATDRLIGPLKSGDIIDLSKVGTYKLTIEALMPTTFSGELRFTLTGRVNRSITHRIAPYTLYGFRDGNYTFGDTGLPAGDYDLTVLPVVIKDGITNFGVPTNITFKVVDNADQIQVSPDAPVSGLVGYWKMDEGQGTVLLDDSGNGNNATIINSSGVDWPSGKSGRSIQLNGNIDRYARLSHNSSINLQDALTVSAWIKPSSISRRQIISKGGPDGYELSIFENGKVEFRINRESNGTLYRLQSNGSYPSDGNTWIHVAVTFDGTNIVMYLNGRQDARLSFPATKIRTNTSPLQIGARSGSNRWSGEIDELRLYSVALSADQIGQLVN